MTVEIRPTMSDLSQGSLPAWVRIGCLAWARADLQGHARLGTGQLGRTLGMTPDSVARALRVARDHGWIDPTSTARCLVLPGCASARCEERHR